MSALRPSEKMIRLWSEIDGAFKQSRSKMSDKELEQNKNVCSLNHH